jgi:hypothetical protein
MTHTTRLDVCVYESDENKQKEQSTVHTGTMHSSLPVRVKGGFPIDDINQTKKKTVSRSS